jgi:hypothetical protein
MIRKVILIATVSLLFTSCATQTFYMQDAHSSAGSSTEDTMQSFFVGGIGQTQKLNAAQICGGADKVVKVEVQQTFLNGFLTGLTGGLYAPRQARVFCSK